VVARRWQNLSSTADESSPATPPLITFLTTWRADPVAIVAIVAAGGLYATGAWRLARRGIRWPVARTLAFFGLGLGSFAVVQFGFLGVHSGELRWAFSTRMALLLFAVPGLLSLGKPVALSRLVLSGAPLRVMDAVLASWPVRLAGNAVFAPVFAFAAFCVFLTPLAGSLRESPAAGGILTLGVPLVGLLMVLPIVEHTTQRTSFFITVEFLLVFVELVMDAIPGILLRLNDSVLDKVGPVLGAVPGWFPNALHDQHLSGDLLWFIAEIADVPVLILLFIRWSRVDRHEAKALDELSDEEMAALTREHLRNRPQ
jgi:cytochrome c oxidase assembly factor CtaG